MKRWLLLSMIIALFWFGCSSSNPIATDKKPMEIPLTQQSEGIPPEIALTPWIYNAHVNVKTGSFELTPLRQSSLTDVLEVVDISNFLLLSPCTDCAKIRSIGLDALNNVTVEIGIRHPFAAGDPLKPISGKNRADLHVFNVEGIIVSPTQGSSFSGLGETVSGVKLINADGYTGYLDNSFDAVIQTQATIYPYITHFDDYSDGNYSASYQYGFQSVTVPGPSGKLVMPMGSDYDYQTYVFDLSEQEIEFLFAIGCTYPIASADMTGRFAPIYRVPQHNKKAASKVSIGFVDNRLISGDTSSTAEIEIKVVDVNHGVPPGGALDEMYSDSSVEKIFVDVPAIMIDLLEIDGSSPISGSGHSPLDPVIYRGIITNAQGAATGKYPLLVKVVDNYPTGSNVLPILNGMNGISRVEPGTTPLQGLFLIDEFATYQVSEVVVGDEYIQSTWPVIQCDIQHTGRGINLNGPQKTDVPPNAPSWTGTYPPGWNFYGNPLPIFLSKDSAYLSTTGDGGPLPAYAFWLSDHTLKWSQQFHDDMQNWLNVKCINNEGTVVLTVETGYDRIIGLDADDGSFKWELPGMIKVDSYPTLDLQGNFIIPLEDVGIQSIVPETGVVNWTATIGDTYYSMPATGYNGVIYTTKGDMWAGNIYALDPSDGSVKWQSESIGLLRGNGVTVHPNGSILVHGGDGLFAFKDNGTSCEKLWSQPYECPFYSSVCIGQDDDIYTIDYVGTLRRIDPLDGTTIMFSEGWGDGVTARPAVGQDGLIYTSYRLYMDNKSYMACFNPDTTLRWQHEGGRWWEDGHYSAPAIGQDGTLYSCFRKYGICGWVDE